MRSGERNEQRLGSPARRRRGSHMQSRHGSGDDILRRLSPASHQINGNKQRRHYEGL